MSKLPACKGISYLTKLNYSSEVLTLSFPVVEVWRAGFSGESMWHSLVLLLQFGLLDKHCGLDTACPRVSETALQ